MDTTQLKSLLQDLIEMKQEEIDTLIKHGHQVDASEIKAVGILIKAQELI